MSDESKPQEPWLVGWPVNWASSWPVKWRHMMLKEGVARAITAAEADPATPVTVTLTHATGYAETSLQDAFDAAVGILAGVIPEDKGPVVYVLRRSGKVAPTSRASGSYFAEVEASGIG